MKTVIDDFLKSSGLIKTRETAIKDDLKDVDDDRDKLDRRISSYCARLESQFIAMERIVQSLQTSGDFFDSINDRLPFTAKQ
jgi:flagellar hook-associated protein 2